MSVTNASSVRELRERLPVRIGGRSYEIDILAMRRVPLESTRIFVDDGAVAGERSLDNRGLWRRSQDDASAGAGQQYRDVLEVSNNKMFETSRGVDPWERRTMQLLPEANQEQAIAAGSRLIAIDGGLVLWNGSDWTRNTDPNGSGTWDAVTGGVTPSAMCGAGSAVYMVDGSDLYRLDSGATAWTNVAATTCVSIWYAAGWVIGAKANRELVWFDDTGSETVIGSHPWTGFEWTSLTAAPEGIYVGGGDTTSTLGGEIWRVEADDVGGLLPPVAASVLPVGERPEAMIYTAGFVVVGTSGGVRTAVVNADESLTYGSLIEMPATVNRLSAYGQYVWFNWSDFPWQELPGGDINLHAGTGRLDLAELNDPLVPAYASDMMDHDEAETSTTPGVVTGDIVHVDDKLWYVGPNFLYQQTDDLVQTGELRVGRISFGIFERKAFESVEVRFGPFGSGSTIEVLSGYDDEVTVASLGDVGGTTERPGVGVVTFTDPSLEQLEREWVDLRFRLQRATAVTTQQTVMERWTIRAVPLPYRSEEITLPILLFDAVERDGHTVKLDAYEEFVFLNSLMHSRAMILLELGREELRGRVDALQSDRLGGSEELDRWNRREEFVVGTWELRFLTSPGPIPLQLRPTDASHT